MAAIVAGSDQEPVSSGQTQIRQRFRPDIDGLRALAVTLVVLFHAGVPGFGGGYVGVDVFFVLSGFLITRGLQIEAETTGKINIVRFWLRRARRLLPAAGAMIAGVTIVQLIVRSPLVWDDALREALAAATYWSNEQAADISGGYFGARVEDRALLHTWSLSVEEQFYLVWPLVFAGLVAAKIRAKIQMAVVIGLIALSSARSEQLGYNDDAGAYFESFSRAWEFLVGAIIALAWEQLTRYPKKLGFAKATARGGSRGLAATIGVSVIVGSAATFDSVVRFPWPLAAVPVVATGVVLVAQVDESQSIGRLLALPMMQLIGRVSYSWYLWHWPVLVLGREVVGREDWPTSLLLVGASFLVAVLSYRVIEMPFRTTPQTPLSREALIAFVLPVGVTLLVIAGGFLYRSRVFTNPLVAEAAIAAKGWPEHLGGCYQPDLPGFEQRCVFGSANGEATILVIGDSHAAHWMPTFDAIGDSNNLRVVALQVGSCPLLAAEPLGPEVGPCGDLRDSLANSIEGFEPDLVVASASESYVDRVDSEIAAWRDGHRNLATQLGKADISFLVLHDIARWESDPLECLLRDDDCGLDRATVEAHREPIYTAERQALLQAGHGQAVDPLDFLCQPTTCEPQDADGVIIMQDSHHLTRDYARSLAPELEPVVTGLLQQ